MDLYRNQEYLWNMVKTGAKEKIDFMCAMAWQELVRIVEITKTQFFDQRILKNCKRF